MSYGSSVAPYGHFDEKEGCFVLTSKPPRKWVNLHYNKPGEHEVYAEITNIGDGPIWVRDNEGCKCNLVGYDSKFLYVRDDDSGVAFCPGGEPAPQKVDDVTCRYYPAKMLIQGTCEQLRVSQRVFVPQDETFEAWTVTIENLSRRKRHVSVFAYAMFQLTGNDALGRGVAKDNSSQILPEIGGVLVANRSRSCPTDRYKGYILTLRDFFAATGYRDYFTRSDFGYGTPKLLWGWDCDNRDGFGPDSAGAVQVKLEISAKGIARADFLIGQTASVAEIKAVRKRVTPAYLDRESKKQDAAEAKRAAMFRVETGHPDQDALINWFSKKQMVSYIINKSGFRDNMQNNLGLSMCDYDIVRPNILRALASQYPDGRPPHGFRPLNDLQYSDKPAWILHCVPWVIKETGDFALLDEVVPYFRSDEKGTVWDHILRAMRFLAKDTGANGLCDQHHADWNDGLEPSEKTGARESVMVTQQFCFGLLEVEELARRRGDAAVQQEARALYEEFKRRLNEVAWDGQWYVRTICASGYRLGSDAHKEGKIFMNTQSWAVLSQTAPPERAKSCMEAVDRMIEHECGFRIAAPPYTQFDERVGKFSASRPNVVENGGCYCHAAGFKGVADCMMGRAEAAWRTFRKVAPGSPWNPIAQSQAEPFSFTNCYSIVAGGMYGKSVYPWRTGTCSWMVQLLVEWILGARRHYDGLLIDPCLTKEIPRAKVTRTFRGTRYEIEIDNTAGRCVGAREITVDGKRLEGNIIAPAGKKVSKVRVMI